MPRPGIEVGAGEGKEERRKMVILKKKCGKPSANNVVTLQVSSGGRPGRPEFNRPRLGSGDTTVLQGIPPAIQRAAV